MRFGSNSSGVEHEVRVLQRLILLEKSANKVHVGMSESQTLVRNELIAAIQTGLLQTEVNQCPVCDNGDYDVIASRERMGIPLESALCRGCPTMYSTMKFTADSMVTFYSDWYRRLSTGRADPPASFRDMQVVSGRRLLKFLESANSFLGYPSRVLDVGCGAGGTLVPFAELGSKCVGIDMDEAFLSGHDESGIDLQVANIENFWSERPFDLVILDDVLEHLGDPVAGILKVRSLLTTNGLVACQVPVLDTLRQLGYRNDLRRYFQLAHVNHFSTASLIALFANVGMEIVRFDGVGQFVFRVTQVPCEVTATQLKEARRQLLGKLARVTRFRRYYSSREKLAGRVPIGIRRIGRRT